MLVGVTVSWAVGIGFEEVGDQIRGDMSGMNPSRGGFFESKF